MSEDYEKEEKEEKEEEFEKLRERLKKGGKLSEKTLRNKQEIIPPVCREHKKHMIIKHAHSFNCSTLVSGSFLFKCPDCGESIWMWVDDDSPVEPEEYLKRLYNKLLLRGKVV